MLAAKLQIKGKIRCHLQSFRSLHPAWENRKVHRRTGGSDGLFDRDFLSFRNREKFPASRRRNGVDYGGFFYRRSRSKGPIEIDRVEVNGCHLINGEEDQVLHHFASRLSAFA